MTELLSHQDTEALFAEAVDRHATIELRRYLVDGETVVLRSRLLDRDDDHLYVEQPVAAGAPPLAFNDLIDVYLMLAGESYRFSSRVVDLRCRRALPDGRSTAAMSMDRPTAVTRQQRREDFRVALPAAHLLRAELQTAVTPQADAGFACWITTPRLPGEVNNLSLGGAAVRLPAEAMTDLANGSLYFLGVQLPDDGRELLFLTELRYHRTAADGAAVAGIKFRSCPLINLTEQLERLGRFISDVQQQQRGRA